MRVWRPFPILLLAVASQAQQIPFKLEIERPVLSIHQRMVAILKVKLDGVEMLKRVGDDELSVRIRIRDEQGQIYTREETFNVRGGRKDEKKAKMEFYQGVFVMPGNYNASVRMLDTVNGQEGFADRDFRVEPLSADPLPEMWRDLPQVEFQPEEDGAEGWYLPSIKGRLHLPLETQQPVKIDVLVNTTPTEFRGGPERQNSANLSLVIPAMKVLLQTEVNNGSLEMSLLDLAKLKVIFSQDNSKPLSFARLKNSLDSANPNMIDVHALSNRERDGDYFVYEVGQRVRAALQPGEPRHVLIILSGPMNFPAGVMLHRVDVRETARCKVFYIRYLPEGSSGIEDGRRVVLSEANRKGPLDELEYILTPLNPRKFQVNSPMAFRKTLAAILAEISSAPL
jgi:hypothetical protein